MTSRVTLRHKEFDLALEIKDTNFICTPMESQRNWVITRALEEVDSDLLHLDNVSKRFVSSGERRGIADNLAKSQAEYDSTQLIIDGQQVMQEWERPYMEAMAKVVTEQHGDVLEIGFGIGISASYILEMGAKSYTVIECNEGVIEKFEDWKRLYPGRDIRLIKGRWQEVISDIGYFDGIFFDTYPLSESEYLDHVVNSSTFAQHFFAHAAAHLRKDGVFTYYSNEIDSVSRRHQRELFKHFQTVSFSVCRNLLPPDGCQYWWADSMIITRAIK